MKWQEFSEISGCYFLAKWPATYIKYDVMHRYVHACPVVHTCPSVCQSSRSLNLSVLLRWMIRCLRVWLQNSYKYCKQQQQQQQQQQESLYIEHCIYSKLPLIWTPEMRPPLYSGHFKMSQSVLPSANSPLKCGHPSNQDTLTGPKGGRITVHTCCYS